MPASRPEALAPARVGLIAPPDWDGTVARGALDLLGASFAEGDPSAALIVAGENLPESRLAALDRDWKLPMLVLPARPVPEDAARAVELFAALAKTGAAAVAAEEAMEFRFLDRPELWPFAGATLTEGAPRLLAAVAPRAGVEPLVAAKHGAVVARARARPVALSLAPLPDPVAVRLLRDELTPERFLGLLPLLLALREALGPAAWRVPAGPRACFIVDDPNLRRERYGFLDLQAVAAAAEERAFHLAIAMIPLDFRKTRERAARLLRERPEALSLLLHGVDHTKREFESQATPAQAEAALVQGLARMEEHRHATGIGFSRAMTFPHGVCNPTWMRAMQRVGLDAVVVSRAFPFAADGEIDDPLYELRPAQMSFGGLPVVNRFKAEEPVERLLFQAWLGKPLVVYTHHDFFRGGLDRLEALTDFLNRTVRPRWADIGTVLRGNYQARQGDGGTVVRVFANRVSIRLGVRRLAALVKHGVLRADGERARLPAGELPVDYVDGVGLVALDVELLGGALDVEFTPEPPPVSPGLLSPPLPSRLRRLATELRDQGRATLAHRL